MNQTKRWHVLGIGIISGLCAVLAGAEPTGVSWVDIPYVVFAVTTIVLICSRAPWWVISVHVTIAAVMAFSLTSIVIGAALYLVAYSQASEEESTRWIKAAVIGVSLNMMFYSQWTNAFGLSSFVGLASNAVFLAMGLKASSLAIDLTRRKVVVGISVFAASLLGLCFAVLMAKEPLTKGNRLVQEGIAAVNQGDLTVASARFDDAHQQMESASGWLNSPLTFFAQAIPVVSQHRAAAAQLSASSSESVQQLSLALSKFDLEKLRVVNGSLDLVAIQDLKEPLTQILAVMNDLRDELTAVQSPWLIGRIQDEFAELSDDLDEQLKRGANAQLALEVAPEMLGSTRPVTYFIALTTPAEARGHGSFMGNWIELSIDAGQIEVNTYGRSTDLNEAGDRPRTVTGPSDWIKRYGGFGFTNAPGGTVGENPWQNITMSPHFPSTAQVITELYPQSGGTKLDGVFAMDVNVLSALLEFAGPVVVEGRDVPLTSDNAVEFLLHDQYVEFAVNDRIDLLSSVTRTALDQILNGELPSPQIMANRLGPLVAQGRLTAYSPNPTIEDLFTRVGMSGSLACEETVDCFAVTVDNASGSKIEYFLDMKVDYSVAVEQGSSDARGTAKITVTNSAPATGLPDYVIGNLVGLPRGYNRMLLSIHSQLVYVRSTTSGGDLDWWSSTEQGHNVSSAYLDVPPGETVELIVELGGPLNLRNGYSVTVRNPPAVRPWTMNIDLVENGKTQTLKTFAEAGTWVLP